jgi:hypothetical protein
MRKIIGFLMKWFASMAIGNANDVSGNSGRVILALGQFVFKIVEATLPNPYVVGGIAIAPADVGLRKLDVLIPLTASSGWALAWDQVNQKLKAFGSNGAAPAALAEATAIDLSAIKVYLLVIGIR